MIIENSTISKYDAKRMHNGEINGMVVKKLLVNFLLEKLSIRSTLTDKCSLELITTKMWERYLEKSNFFKLFLL